MLSHYGALLVLGVVVARGVGAQPSACSDVLAMPALHESAALLEQLSQLVSDGVDGLLDSSGVKADTTGVNKRKHEYLRFGKRKHEYLRFGKRKHEYLRFGRK